MKQSRCWQERHYENETARPDTHGILIPGKRGRLLSVLYTAGGEGLHPAVLLCHGIPGCERNFDLAQALRRTGFHVMTFHYSGCWGSDGGYSLRHNIEDAETVLDYMLRDERYGIDTTRIYAVGHSLGGFVCGQLAARRQEIQGGVLLMPCNIGRLPQMEREAPEVYRVLLDILEDSAPWLNDTTAEALAQEARENSQVFRLENLADSLVQKPLLCVDGSLDIYTPAAQHTRPLIEALQTAGGTRLRSLTYPTDHFFSDYRLELSGVICDFLWGLAFPEESPESV